MLLHLRAFNFSTCDSLLRLRFCFVLFWFCKSKALFAIVFFFDFKPSFPDSKFRFFFNFQNPSFIDVYLHLRVSNFNRVFSFKISRLLLKTGVVFSKVKNPRLNVFSSVSWFLFSFLCFEASNFFNSKFICESKNYFCRCFCLCFEIFRFFFQIQKLSQIEKLSSVFKNFFVF